MTNIIGELLKKRRMEFVGPIDQNLLIGLYDLITEFVTKDSYVVEIGSYSGVSSELFALHCKKLFCIDQWQKYTEIEQDKLSNAELVFDKLLEKYNNITKIKQSSIISSENFINESIDLVYIDASHSYSDVKDDILAWLPKVKSGGIISGHDFYMPGVNKAVNDIFGHRKIKIYRDTSWLLEVSNNYTYPQ